VIDDESYMKIISIFIKDPNDNIRVNSIDNLVVLRNHKTPLKFQEFIINCFSVIVNDESWRIRYTFADKIHEVKLIKMLVHGLFESQLEYESHLDRGYSKVPGR
jgi:hypothetical protein